MQAVQELELTVVRTIAASRKAVFEAWLAPEMLARFMRPPLADAHEARVETDPVEGGRFLILMVTAERDIPHAGTYLEIEPHSRLAFTWESPHSLDDSVVTIDFVQIDERTTELTLRQVKFRNEQARDGHVSGWNAIISHLADLLTSFPRQAI